MQTDAASPKARLFIALELPRELAGAIAAWQRAALDGEAWRAVRPDALHLTILFLGSRPEDQIPVLAERVGAVAPSAPLDARLRPVPVGIPGRRPRAVAFEVDSDAVAELAGSVSEALTAAGLLEPEARPYWPHVTVARRRKQARESSPAAPRHRRPALPDMSLPAEASQPLSLSRLVLFRSETMPDGARHQPEAVFEIGSGPG